MVKLHEYGSAAKKWAINEMERKKKEHKQFVLRADKLNSGQEDWWMKGRRGIQLGWATLWWKVKRLVPFSPDRHRQVITWERASLLTVKGYSAQYSLAWRISPSIHPRAATDELFLAKEAQYRPRAKWAHICTPHIQKCHWSWRKCQNARTPDWRGVGKHTHTHR